MEIRLWIEFLVDFERNYVTLCTSINFISNWKSTGGEGNRPNRALVFYFIYIKRVLEANCLYKKFKIGRLLAVSLGLFDFVYPFSISGQQTLKWLFRFQFKHDFPYTWYFPLGWEPLQNLHFLIISFDFSLGSWWRGLRSLLILQRLAADWDWRISRASFRVSSAACRLAIDFITQNEESKIDYHYVMMMRNNKLSTRWRNFKQRSIKLFRSPRFEL